MEILLEIAILRDSNPLHTAYLLVHGYSNANIIDLPDQAENYFAIVTLHGRVKYFICLRGDQKMSYFGINEWNRFLFESQIIIFQTSCSCNWYLGFIRHFSSEKRFLAKNHKNRQKSIRHEFRKLSTTS